MSFIKRKIDSGARDMRLPCEMHNTFAREDGSTLCGLPADHQYRGRVMCDGHHTYARAGDEQIAEANRKAMAYIESIGATQHQNLTGDALRCYLAKFRKKLSLSLDREKCLRNSREAISRHESGAFTLPHWALHHHKARVASSMPERQPGDDFEEDGA
jgi:hypothetical protein